MQLILYIKTKYHTWRWDLTRTLKLLSNLLIAILLYIALVTILCLGTNAIWL